MKTPTFTILFGLFGVMPAASQISPAVDFETDVLPLFRQHCIGCHGPDQQMAGYRLDRRSVALREDFSPIPPAERLVLRLTGSQLGPSMPPTGPLAAEEIAVVRDWVAQGAPWPDHLANERELPPPNPQAVHMADLLRVGGHEEFVDIASDTPELLNARGTDGSTPFMVAALYGDASLVSRLIALGGDPNIGNDAGVTALIWAATDPAKVRILVDAGADVNARSDNARTPLFAAATRHGNAGVLELLIEQGAEVNPPNLGPADSTPLVEAARVGDAEMVRLLVDRGADARAVGGMALTAAFLTRCGECVDRLVAEGLDASAFTEALFATVPDGNIDTARFLLDHGADLDARDPFGRTPLMYAVASDLLPLDIVRLFVERGADVNAISNRDNETPLGIARRRGPTPIVDFLVSVGATAPPDRAPQLAVLETNAIEDAIGRSIPLLQAADRSFTARSGCVSCHNNSIPAMAISLARSGGFPVDEQVAQGQVIENAGVLARAREQFRQGISLIDIADVPIFSYVLIGQAGEGYEPDATTDAVVMHLERHQLPDGHWPGPLSSVRPPLTNGVIGWTALGLRAIQLYPPNVDRDRWVDAVDRAAAWLATDAQPRTTGDRAWRLLGLAWADRDPSAIEEATAELLALQRDDGGWAELDTLASGPFETGQALVALEAAGVPVSDAAYQRGVRFLVNSQLADGSWFVQTRALGFQPYFDNGFPHQLSQWISGAATSWATMALTLASE